MQLQEATKSKNIKDVFDFLYERVCSGEQFNDSEKDLLNQAAEKFSNVPLQAIQPYIAKFLDLDIMKVDFSILEGTIWNEYIFKAMMP